MIRKSVFFVSLSVALLAPLTGNAQDDPKWTIAPYLWGPSISLDTSSSDSGSGGIAVSDLLEKIDAVGMLHMEWRPSRFGLVMDYMFMDLSDSESKEILLPPAPAYLINSEINLKVLELAGFSARKAMRTTVSTGSSVPGT